jgi:sugar phosphate isomerase/epimerase
MPDLALGAALAFDFKEWDVDEEIAILRSSGVGRVHIYRNYTQGITADHIREKTRAACLVIDSLHGYFQLEEDSLPRLDLSSDDETLRRASVEIIAGEADFARQLGCRDIVVHPGPPPGDTRKQPFRPAAFESSLRSLTEIARRTDVRFCIENMPPPMFGCDVSMVRRMIDAINSPHLGQCYDSGHAMLAADPLGVIRTMGPRLWIVHLHDNDGKEDDHRLPGMGIVPFEDVARTLAEVGFAGTFLLEIYRKTEEVRRDLTPARLAFIEQLRRLASGG